LNMLSAKLEDRVAWRRESADEHPNDCRFRNAAEILERLALEGGAGAAEAKNAQYEQAWARHQDEYAGEITDFEIEWMERVGFDWFPNSFDEVVDKFLANVEKLAT
jgi:hypothetical protein